MSIIQAIIVAVVASGITGVISAIFTSQLTIAGLRVHIEYLRSTDDRHEKAINRAHQRIDEIERPKE